MNEYKEYYSSVNFIHMGDAELKFYSLQKYSNSKVELYNSNNLIAESRLNNDGLLSKANIFIPRNLQPNSDAISIIKIDDNSVDTIFGVK